MAFKFIGKLASKHQKALKTLHLKGIAASLDVRKLVKDPKGFATTFGKGVTSDAKHFVSFWARVKSGDFKSIGQQGARETIAAFGGSKKLQEKAASIGAKGGKAYSVYKSGGYDTAIKAYQDGGITGAASAIAQDAARKAADQASRAATPKAEKASATKASTSSGGSTLVALGDNPPSAGPRREKGLIDSILAALGLGGR